MSAEHAGWAYGKVNRLVAGIGHVCWFFAGLSVGFRACDSADLDRRTGRCEMRCELTSHDTGELRDGACVCIDTTAIGGER